MLAPSTSDAYYELSFARDALSQRLEAIERAIVPGSTILDLGCNDGRIAKRLLERGLARHVHAVDVHDLVSPLPSGLTFTRADLAFARVQDFPEVDAVLFLNIAHHLIASTGRAVKGLIDGLLDRSPLLLIDLGSFTEHGDWPWRTAYERYWRTDLELWEDLLGNAHHKTPLLYYPAQHGGARLLWKLEGRSAEPPRATPRRADRQAKSSSDLRRERIAIVTDVDFWTRDAGHRARIHAMVEYVRSVADLTVVSLRATDAAERSRVEATYPGLAFEARASNQEEHVDRWLQDVLRQRGFSRVIVHYAYLHWIVDLVDDNTVTVVDTHDLLALRAHAFWMNRREPPIDVTVEEEQHWIDKFDYAAFIQPDELNIASRYLPADKCLLCPHPVATRDRIQRAHPHVVGFIGSQALPNQDGVTWFAERVLPLLQTPDVIVTVFGTVCLVPGLRDACPALDLVGPVESIDCCYDAIDIAINPVRYGGGLNIKSVEALAYGCPLVSTSCGVRGLGGTDDITYAVADTAETFAARLDELLAASVEERERMATAARALIETSMTPERCFGPLLGR